MKEELQCGSLHLLQPILLFFHPPSFDGEVRVVFLDSYLPVYEQIWLNAPHIRFSLSIFDAILHHARKHRKMAHPTHRACLGRGV